MGTATVSRAAAGRRLDALGRFDNGEWYAREAPRLVATRVDETAQDTVGIFRIDLDGLVGERIAIVPISSRLR